MRHTFLLSIYRDVSESCRDDELGYRYLHAEVSTGHPIRSNILQDIQFKSNLITMKNVKSDSLFVSFLNSRSTEFFYILRTPKIERKFVLKHPNSDTDFVPTPGYLVGDFRFMTGRVMGQELKQI